MYNPDGYHYVFRLTKGKAERLDNSTYHGGNFQRYLFHWKGNLFALVGYGFFTTNNNLIFYNTRLKRWTYKNTTGDKPKFILGTSFLNKNKINSFNNYRCGNETTKDVLDSNLYILVLSKMLWKKYRLSNKNIHFTGRSYYTKDYVLFVGPTHSLILLFDII